MSTIGGGEEEPTSGTAEVPGRQDEADYRAYVYVAMMVVFGIDHSGGRPVHRAATYPSPGFPS